MKLEISRIDWSVPCKDVWDIIESHSETAVNQLFFELLTKELGNILASGDKEFLAYEVTVDGSPSVRIVEYLDFLNRKEPGSLVSRLYRQVFAKRHKML